MVLGEKAGKEFILKMRFWPLSSLEVALLCPNRSAPSSPGIPWDFRSGAWDGFGSHHWLLTSFLSVSGGSNHWIESTLFRLWS